MAKPRIPNQRKANIEHKKRTERYAQLIQQLYDRVAQEAARLASLAGVDSSKPFSFADYPLTKESIQGLQQQLSNDVGAVIMSGTSEEWKESNLVQNLVARKVLKAYTGTTKSGEEYTRYYQTNPDALKAFQKRREGGMNLSDRVWNLSEEYRVELEDAISAAIAPGISAQELSREVKKYLNEPDLMFRRFRYKNENGEWKRKWKKRYTDEEGNVRFIDCDRDSYRNQWTGPGYYKSAAKNAMRLARTEINMAYRTAEQTRWEQFDFVVGYEVKTTQNGHHKTDICDRLAGKYPKDFKFTGWHPQCMCYCIPILKTEEEFWAYDPENPEQSENEITELPPNFRDWVDDNKERIKAAEKRGKLPYFIRDNREDVEEIMNPKERKKTPLEIAADRHAARTPEDVERIRFLAQRRSEYLQYKSDPNYTDVEFNYDNGGLKATHKGHEVHSSKESKKFFGKFTTTDFEKMCQNILFNNGHSCILENEHIFDNLTGKQLTALDTKTDGRYMDIFSITKNGKNTISNGFKRKRKQIIEFNELYGSDFHEVIIFFYKSEYYNENAVRNCLSETIREATVVFGNGKVFKISKK